MNTQLQQMQKAFDEVSNLIVQLPEQALDMLFEQYGEKMPELFMGLVQYAQLGGEQAAAAVNKVVELSQQGNEKATALVLAVQQLQLNLVAAAKRGMKLDYLKLLKGICPEGYEVTYMKAGGSVCPVCQKKKEMQTEKCGGKAKKPMKAMDGIKAELAKCGKKMPKHEFGGYIDMFKCGGKKKMIKGLDGVSLQNQPVKKVTSKKVIHTYPDGEVYEYNDSTEFREHSKLMDAFLKKQPLTKEQIARLQELNKRKTTSNND